jgi:hypothetical protein
VELELKRAEADELSYMPECADFVPLLPLLPLRKLSVKPRLSIEGKGCLPVACTRIVFERLLTSPLSRRCKGTMTTKSTRLVLLFLCLLYLFALRYLILRQDAKTL